MYLLCRDLIKLKCLAAKNNGMHDMASWNTKFIIHTFIKHHKSSHVR